MKIILHLCADVGSDSYPYQIDPAYEVIRIGKDIGVENYAPPANVHGIIANPVCTDFSAFHGFNQYKREPDLSIVQSCQRIISESNPSWWMIENPATGTMRNYLGNPIATYDPWMYGSPWTKRTALWGKFRMPMPIYTKWAQVPVNSQLYIRPMRNKPSIAFLHKSAIHHIPEFAPFIDSTKTDNDFRSLCSQGFAQAFKQANP